MQPYLISGYLTTDTYTWKCSVNTSNYSITTIFVQDCIIILCIVNSEKNLTFVKVNCSKIYLYLSQLTNNCYVKGDGYKK